MGVLFLFWAVKDVFIVLYLLSDKDSLKPFLYINVFMWVLSKYVLYLCISAVYEKVLFLEYVILRISICECVLSLSLTSFSHYFFRYFSCVTFSPGIASACARLFHIILQDLWICSLQSAWLPFSFSSPSLLSPCLRLIRGPCYLSTLPVGYHQPLDNLYLSVFTLSDLVIYSVPSRVSLAARSLWCWSRFQLRILLHSVSFLLGCFLLAADAGPWDDTLWINVQAVFYICKD